MALQRKLDEGDIALAIVMQDPIFLAEFLNNTNFGDMNRQNWKKGEPFKLRPYQRELISDRTKNIVLVGGRAIGKCQPAGTRIYTTEGYKTITELKDRPYFTVYSVDQYNNINMRRAVIKRDSVKPVYRLKTVSGHSIKGTDVHPLLTPDGYKLMQDIHVGDKVAITQKLPTTHNVVETFLWHEARLLGYMILQKYFPAELNIKPRFRAIRDELEFINDKFYCKFEETTEGYVRFKRIKRGIYKHPVNYLKTEIGAMWRNLEAPINISIFRDQKLEIIQVFLEALFAQHARLHRNEIYLEIAGKKITETLQELLLYFGIESLITKDSDVYKLTLAHDRARYKFWKTFNLPGVDIGTLSEPVFTFDEINEYLRWDMVTENNFPPELNETFSVHVYKDETYIAQGIVNHNSITIENLLIHQILNSAGLFEETPEQLLATPNQNQLTPLLDKVVGRFNTSPLLRHFLEAKNLSKGTFDFKTGSGKLHRMYARIAGSKTENNLVGLHVEKIAIDEAQLFSMGNFHQVLPTLNQWAKTAQQLYSGVHNGVVNMTLYQLDQKATGFKKYRIPSPNNPYFTYQDWVDSIKRYGGEETDLFLQLVLAKPGNASFSVVNRESMIILDKEFYQYRYTSKDKAENKGFKDVLKLPKIPGNAVASILGIDTGFVDPTIIQLFILVDDKWRVFARWKLQRIEFPEQEVVIDWITRAYNIHKIALDIGAGGGGAGMTQSLQTRPEYRGMNYNQRIIPVNFGDTVNLAEDPKKPEEFISVPLKTFGARELVTFIENGNIAFSELDTEGISQIERIAKQKSMSGIDRYFVMSERGTGASNDDHIFASYICFMMGLQKVESSIIRKLGRPTTGVTR